MSDNKTAPTSRDPIQFLNTVENETRRKDGFVIMKMMKRITGMEPVMWGPTAIGYGYYKYCTPSGHKGEAGLIAFSPRKQRLVLYVLNGFEGQDRLLAMLGKHQTGKICLYINKLADVDTNVLEEIIEAAFNRVKHKQQVAR